MCEKTCLIALIARLFHKNIYMEDRLNTVCSITACNRNHPVMIWAWLLQPGHWEMNFDNCFSHLAVLWYYSFIDTGVQGPHGAVLKWPLVRKPHERYSVLKHLVPSNKLFTLIKHTLHTHTHTYTTRNLLFGMWLLSLSMSWCIVTET